MKISRCCCNFSLSALLLFFGVASACACEIKEDKCCPSNKAASTPCYSHNEATEHKNCLHCDDVRPNFTAVAGKISLELDLALVEISHLITTRKLPNIQIVHFSTFFAAIRNSTARAPPVFLS